MVRPKFIIDTNVGKLATWLRALGYDALFINPIDDGDLVRIAEAEHRVVLTKDTGIMERRVVTGGTISAFLVHSTDSLAQLVEVVHAFALNDTQRFTRCLCCNTELESCPAELARRQVPPLVASIHDEYWHCPRCRRYYWKGSHWQRMSRMLAVVFKTANAQQ